MRLRSWLALVAASFSTLTAPALAGTIPPAEQPPGKTSAELGFYHAAIDRTVSEQVVVGAMGWALPRNAYAAALRVGYTFVRTPKLTMGGLVSGGVTGLNGDPFSLGTTQRWETRTWLQPALNLTASLWPEPSTLNFRVRATAGPILNLTWAESGNLAVAGNPPGFIEPWIWPNVELVFQLWPGLEFTAGFPDLAGVRASW